MLRRFLKLLFHTAFLVLFAVCTVNHNLCLYLYYQARGQLRILTHTQGIAEYKASHTLTEKQAQSLDLIQQVKQYAEDSLGFTKTNNYQSIYDQHGEPILWAVTLSESRALKPFYWHFPVIGSVSYKGFFEKEKAEAEAYHYTANGYDAEIRPVSAWSTLGWLKDPILSSMLQSSKGTLCNLVFHELFHSTYYAPGTVEDNENLATFIGDKATRQFLRHDTAALNAYLYKKHDDRLYRQYMAQSTGRLKAYYKNRHYSLPGKLKLLMDISAGLDTVPFKNPKRFAGERAEIMQYKNAYFVGFNQYHQEQDSLETAFNKFYKGNLRNMVLSLKQQAVK